MASERTAVDMVERLRKHRVLDAALPLSGRNAVVLEDIGKTMGEASALIASQAEEIERWRRNSAETWHAMNAMRNDINEHVPMPSIEADLMDGPENSVFFAAVAISVVEKIVGLKRDIAAYNREYNLLEDALAKAADNMRCVKQQCETAIYNITQRDHDGAVVRSFQSIADFAARTLTAEETGNGR